MFRVLQELHEKGCRFHVSILGESYGEIPSVFDSGKKALCDTHVRHFGFVESKRKSSILSDADIVLSTALRSTV